LGENIDEIDTWPGQSHSMTSGKTIFAVKVDKKLGTSVCLSQPSFVDNADECMTDEVNESISTISNYAPIDGLNVDDARAVKKIATLVIPLATSEYSRAAEINKNQRTKFIPQLPTSHNSSSKTKSPISNRSKYNQKSFAASENVFALRGTAPVYHEYPRSSPVDIRTPKKKQFVVVKALNSKATSVVATDSNNLPSGGSKHVNSIFTHGGNKHVNSMFPVQEKAQLDSPDSLSHYEYSIQQCLKVSPPTLPLDNNLDDRLVLLIESRTVYQNYFCEKFQILDVVCDPCMNFYDARDVLLDSPVSYDIIFISLSDLVTCKDMIQTLNALNPGGVYSVVAYGALGSMPKMDETLGVLQEAGVTNLLDEPYSLLDMKKMMQKLRRD